MTYREQEIFIDALSKPSKVRAELAHLLLESLEAERQGKQIATGTKFIEITEARYVSEYKIRLVFNDGTVRIMDFGLFLAKAHNSEITEYRDLRKFKSFRIEHGELIWGDYQMLFPVADLHRGELWCRKI